MEAPGVPVSLAVAARLLIGVGVPDRVGLGERARAVLAAVPLVVPLPAGTLVAMVTIPGAERVGAIAATVALVFPAVLADVLTVPADVLTDDVLTVVLAAPVAFPVTVADAPARVGLATAVLGIGVERPGVSVAVMVVTVHAERIALNAAPAAPLRSMRRENRVGLISSTRSSSIC